MFVLPSVFPGPVVTKGRFPSVTAELSQARVPLAPVREAWGTLQGLATCREGALPPGCQALPPPPSSALPCLGTCGLLSWHFPQALARNIPEPGSSGRRLGVRRPLAGWRAVRGWVSGGILDLSQDAAWGMGDRHSGFWQDPLA